MRRADPDSAPPNLLADLKDITATCKVCQLESYGPYRLKFSSWGIFLQLHCVLIPNEAWEKYNDSGYWQRKKFRAASLLKEIQRSKLGRLSNPNLGFHISRVPWNRHCWPKSTVLFSKVEQNFTSHRDQVASYSAQVHKKKTYHKWCRKLRILGPLPSIWFLLSMQS